MPFAISGNPPPPPPEAPEPPPRVEVIDNKIVIHEKIQFEYDKAIIMEASFDLLSEIAQTIKDNAHIKKISIEGHASAEGSDKYNLKLSDARAKSVMKHLVEKGSIPAEMLVAKGFGETQPIASNDDEAGREANRRVEFIILEQDVTEKKVQVDSKTGKKKVMEEKTKKVKHPKAAEEPPAADDASAGDEAPAEDEKKGKKGKKKKKGKADKADEAGAEK